MKAIMINTLLASFLLIGCSHEGSFDPTYFNEVFQGITYRDAEGNINGPVDPSDWRLQEGPVNVNVPKTVSGETVNKILPEDFGQGAYPNPADGPFTLEFQVPVYTTYTIEIINDNLQTVRSFQGTFEAGVHHLVLDGRDERGNVIFGGIYRVVYQLGPYHGYGDIWIVD